MNLKKYILSGLAVLILVPTLSMGMDRKDGDNSTPQPAQAQAEPPFQNPLAQPAQPARQRSNSVDSDASEIFYDVMEESRQQADQKQAANQANNDNNIPWKKVAANIVGSSVGAICGYSFKKLWQDRERSSGFWLLWASVALIYGPAGFAREIGASERLAALSMFSSAILAETFNK